MKVFAIIVGCAALGACGVRAKEARLDLHEVKVRVDAACVPADTPDAPAYSDDRIGDLLDPVDRMKARAAANQQRRARLSILEPIVQHCR